MPTKLQQARERLLSTSAQVESQLRAEFEQLMQTNPKAAMLPSFGFAGSDGELGPRGYGPDAPMKYLGEAEAYIQRFYQFLPFFIGLEKVFEIGVGVGHLLFLLREVLEVDATGCDVDVANKAVYREMRKALGLEPHVRQFKVKAGRELPVAPGTQAICAFYTVFNYSWGVAEHEWFLKECRSKLSGPRMVILRLNPRGFTDNPKVFEFYQKRAVFPLRDEGFCLIDA